MKTRPYALLMIVSDAWELQHHAPSNFFNWSKKARCHYIRKRWPSANWCGNGVPWGMGGSRSFCL